MTPQLLEPKLPPFILTATEASRGLFEFASFHMFAWPLWNLPQGDGHSILVLPGFLTGDHATRPMRQLFEQWGYVPHGWGMGRNIRFTDELELFMLGVVERLADKSGMPISIVGWSLGGVFGRELAKQVPQSVRQVITLGSPITDNPEYSVPAKLYSAINSDLPDRDTQGRLRNISEPPPVPTTSILSKTDGIVAWQGSVQQAHKSNPNVENILVPASHVGLGVNPFVMLAIADRLAQSAGEWKPYNRSGWREFLYEAV